ncbi:STAS/SEC14 domain-containing protein [Roseovarius salis]|uniref:STAS/SEC14 domain-containing protein n=1 Tax=Roseovarius salis TaxID=3376063 RepID=UPI0037C867BD
MIEVESATDTGILEVRMTPPVTDSDYTETLLPAIDAAIASGVRVRILAIVEAGFADFTLGAMLQDARAGLKHWRGFDRAAVVTDNAALRTAVAAFSVFMPCPVARFGMKELEAARRWLRESLGTIQQEEIGDGVLHVSLRGKLDAAAYENDIEDLNRYLARHDTVRLLIDLRDFDGWQGLDALRDHFELVRGHVGRVERAAVVGDAGWQDMAVSVGKRVFGVEARHFAGDAYEAARVWLTA